MAKPGTIEWLQEQAEKQKDKKFETNHEPFPDEAPVFGPRVGPAQHVVTEDPPDITPGWVEAYNNLRESFKKLLDRVRETDQEVVRLKNEIKIQKAELKDKDQIIKDLTAKLPLREEERQRIDKRLDKVIEEFKGGYLKEAQEIAKEVEAWPEWKKAGFKPNQKVLDRLEDEINDGFWEDK